MKEKQGEKEEIEEEELISINNIYTCFSYQKIKKIDSIKYLKFSKKIT
jgi:hypothetical protein